MQNLFRVAIFIITGYRESISITMGYNDVKANTQKGWKRLPRGLPNGLIYVTWERHTSDDCYGGPERLTLNIQRLHMISKHRTASESWLYMPTRMHRVSLICLTTGRKLYWIASWYVNIMLAHFFYKVALCTFTGVHRSGIVLDTLQSWHPKESEVTFWDSAESFLHLKKMIHYV